jgi:hypothetical protein
MKPGSKVDALHEPLEEPASERQLLAGGLETAQKSRLGQEIKR